MTKHQDYSGKYCPHRTLDLGWERFLNNIKEKLLLTRERPFLVGDIIYNTEDLYLHETAGYGGKELLLGKNTKSVVKKYHYNKGLYMALGDEKTYYDAAWTNDYSKFTKEASQNEITIIKEDELSNSNIEFEEVLTDNPKEEVSDTANSRCAKLKDNLKEIAKGNPLLWLLNKIVKFIIKMFRRKR